MCVACRLTHSHCSDANTQNHPLRLCATRLKAKAEHLLKYITDRKERADLSVPVDLSVPSSGRRAPSHPPAKLNGINGHIHTLSLLPSRPPSSNDSRTGHRLTPAWTPPRRVRGQSFEESPAIIRTAEGMAAIFELEQSLDALLSAPGPSSHADALNALLRSHIGESDSDADDGADSDAEGIVLDGATGDKRKLFVFTRASAIDSILMIYITETAYMTLACESGRASPCPMLRKPSNSGGTLNHPMHSSQIPFHLFRLSQLPVLVPHPLRRNHKINLPVPQRQRDAKSDHQSLLPRAHALCSRR